MEGTDILEAKIKITKTKKNSGKEYKFSNTHQTTNIKFYEYDPYNEVKTLLVDVPIEKIVSNSYSLNYAEYIEKKEEKYGDGIVIKTLSDVCEFQNGTQIDKKDIIDGNIPIFGGGKKIMGFHNNHNRNGNETIVCGTGAYAGYINNNLGKPFWASQCFTFKSKNINIINDKYLYYYSKIILEPIFIAGQKGTAIPFIRYSQIIDKKIPIPSIEKQEEIVKYLDFIYEKAIKSSEEKIKELRTLNEFCLNTQKIFGENDIKNLGEVCDFQNGKSIIKGNLIKGDYPVIGGGQKPMGFHNEYNTPENVILCSSSGAYAGFINKYNRKTWASDCFSIIPKNNFINNIYLYNFLKTNQKKIYDFQSGAAQPHVYSKDLKSIKLQIPSIEKQEEIVKYCEFNDELIKQLEKEIVNNKKQARMFINCIIKSKDGNPLIQNLTENDSADINEEYDEVSE